MRGAGGEDDVGPVLADDPAARPHSEGQPGDVLVRQQQISLCPSSQAPQSTDDGAQKPAALPSRSSPLQHLHWSLASCGPEDPHALRQLLQQALAALAALALVLPGVVDGEDHGIPPELRQVLGELHGPNGPSHREEGREDVGQHEGFLALSLSGHHQQIPSYGAGQALPASNARARSITRWSGLRRLPSRSWAPLRAWATTRTSDSSTTS